MIEVLVPTHHKNKKEILEMVKRLNISSNVLVCNQCGTNKIEDIDNVRIVNTDNIGVSKNRNNLMDHASGDICICTDDDCQLVDNYENIVLNFFKNHPDCEIVLFNGIVTKENDRLVHNKKTKRVTKFTDVSYAGGPGFAFKKEFISKYNIRFNERVGYPNYIYLGEDTLFAKAICKSKAKFYRSHDVLFIVKDDVDNSIYFKDVSDQYLITKGYITKLVHPFLRHIYLVRYSLKLRHWRNNKHNMFYLYKAMKKGFKYNVNKELN